KPLVLRRKAKTSLFGVSARPMRLHTHTIIAVSALIVAPVSAWSAKRTPPSPTVPPKIKVVYPLPGQQIGPVDSTFILGSVTPGATLTINGESVDVYRTGGFLAWLPVSPGDFRFRLKARNKRGTDTLTVPVVIVDNRPIPVDSGLRIRDGSVRPMWTRTVRPGDEISVSFDGTVRGTARFRVISPRDTIGPIPMTELRAQSLSDFATFQRDELTTPDSLPVVPPAGSGRGRYHGIWRVPVGLPSDTLRMRVELGSKMGTTKPVTAEAPGALIPVESRPPRVVELIDSVQILRTGPRLGYLTIFQPYGVRARWWGEAGPWTIVQPAPGYEAWIETEKTRLMPEGTPQPGSLITRLSTIADSASTLLIIGTTERLPFKVTVAEDLRSVRVVVFGATSNTDWVEPDPHDDMIDDVVWTQTVPQVYEVEARLREPLWGYDARYEGERLVVEFRRAPAVKSGLHGLTVAVDAGHSADPGAIGPTGLLEKDVNLKLAHVVKTALEKLGARVVMTRNGDEDVPLYDRPAIARRGGADIFVSVHNNAVPDGVNPLARNGTTTYYYHPFSRDLARAVHKQVRQATRLDDLGTSQGNFAVIRPTRYPSVLVECAFIIIPQQEEMLQTRSFIARTGKAIAAGVADLVHERLGP
ncbi:MAG: N-acetylmuramoyl-L-alanine amidase, partial [Candidatus Zixiibacteriota bacterium]